MLVGTWTSTTSSRFHYTDNDIISKPIQKSKLANENQPNKKGKTMNPQTQFKKMLILPLLIALALVVGAVPARATPGCGTTNTNLLSPVPAGYFPDGLLDLMCRELPGTRLPWYLRMNIRGDSDVYVTQITFQP